MSTDPWVWIAALFTLAIFSYLYKDNPLYKAAEHLFVGVAAGYYLTIQFDNVLVPNLLQPVARATAGMFGPGDARFADVIRFLALALTLLMFTRFLPKGSWLSRWPIGVMVGAYAGLAVIGFSQGDFMQQIRSSLIPLVAPGSWGTLLGARSVTAAITGFLGLIANLVLVVGLLATLYYFFFSAEHRGWGGRAARLGVYFLMVSFGASYGFTVMARISLALDRLRFLFVDWLGMSILR